jgi:RHS repeat-associated protein
LGNVVKHYAYTAFGQDRSPAQQPCAFNVSHRYTGQIFDEATGLYYYDAELARFIQPDSIVPSAGDPQTLNRYSYARNNPLIYVDPSGNDFGLTAFLITVAISVASNVAITAAQGGNIGLAFATGLVGGVLGGLGAWAGSAFLASTLGEFWGAVVGGAIGGAAGGAAGAAMTGGDVGLGALAGGIGGAIGGAVGFKTLKWDLPGRVAAQVISGSVSGGIASVIHGGNFWQGMAWGAAGAAIASGIGAVIEIATQTKEDHSSYKFEQVNEVARVSGKLEYDPNDPVISDANVRAEFDRAYKESNPGGTGPPPYHSTNVREQGGWIFRREDGSLLVVRVKEGDPLTIDLGPRTPKGAIANFHTHAQLGMQQEPTRVDVRLTMNRYRVPSYVISRSYVYRIDPQTGKVTIVGNR